jgi:hypothetical protein
MNQQHLGVFQRGDKWLARINYEAIRYDLGIYDTFEEAAAAVDRAINELHNR